MSNAKQTAKTSVTRRKAGSVSTISGGVFATLAHLLRVPGSGAPFFARVLLAPVLLAAALFLPAPAQAAFQIEGFDVTFTGPQGEAITRAGTHPFAMTTSFGVSGQETSEGGFITDESLKDFIATQVPGLAGSTAIPRCTTADFLTLHGSNEASCSDNAAVGIAFLALSDKANQVVADVPIFNLEPAPGEPARLGFQFTGVPVIIDVGLDPQPPYEIVAGSRGTSQLTEVAGAEITLWGIPADPRHDALRGSCLAPEGSSRGSCPAGVTPAPLLTLPRACHGPLASGYEADSWQRPGAFLADGRPDLSDPSWVTGSAETHEEAGNPQGFTGCGSLPFSPEISAQPTSKAATSPTGLDFSLDLSDEGITSHNEGATAASDVEKVEVTLPEGMSVNPSQAEGLAVCSEADLARESAESAPGAGCPDAAKIGTIEVESPLLPDKLLKGALYVATPYANPFDSLIAFYIVIKNPELGISVIQPAKVSADPATGRLVTTTENMPELPFSHFRLHFKEGTRSPIVTPAACGAYAVTAKLFPSSGNPPVTSSSSFEVISGPDNGPCPSGGLPPFHPGLIAGTLNNAAGHFSPFNVRLFRSDSEQEITHFSIKLPPGVVGKLAGIPFCPDTAIAAAAARTGPHGGAEELAAPSCPAASEIGHTLVGSGVGPSLTYVPGEVYLAGPYHGAPLSVVAITSAVAGPFDLGTVVVREALRINPETAEVFVDATGSDPIPHIIKGIPVHLRDVRVYVDRPDFVLNPTSCKPTSTASTVLGSGLDFASEADDNPVTVTTRFQAADCAALGFKPQLALRLRGKTKRGGNPALRAVLRPRVGDANAARISVALPHSEFLDQGHIRTICTRVQFAAGAGNGAQCPKGSVYGRARAWTPLLDQPLEGPIFLRSSEHPLPDLVLALHGLIDVDAVGRIDSVKGGIRNTFDFVPDAPVTKVVVNFQGGKKGLLENSTNICRGKHNATVKMEGHNGRLHNFLAPLRAKCGKHGKHRKRHSHRRR